MEIICLDTNVLIAHKRAKKADKDKTFLFRLTTQGYQLAVASITVLDFDSHCAEVAAKIYQDLKKRGMLIESEDLLIAATALGNQMRLATGNVKHFNRVVGLGLVVDEI
jgi:predicted nucleic acid-binding protein